MGNILKKIFKNPDLTLYNLENKIYLRRWWILPKGKFPINIYLHNFMSSDEERAQHDHPWWSISLLLSGNYLEHMPLNHKEWVENRDRREIIKKRYPFIPTFRNSEAIHRIELFKKTDSETGMVLKEEKSVWTIFITGPKVRDWGFWCPKSWKYHKDFLNDDENAKGAGCDDE